MFKLNLLETIKLHSRDLKTLLFVFVCNVLICYSLMYSSYKRHDLSTQPYDSAPYLSLAKNPIVNNEINPFRYRILTPILVKASSYFLPFYNPSINSKLSETDKQYFFTYHVVNFLFLMSSSVLFFYFFWSIFKTNFVLSYIGCMLYILSFYNIISTLSVSVDGGTYFFIILGLISYYKQQRWLLLIISLLGVFQKETVVLILIIFLFLESIKARKFLIEFLYVMPSVLAYQIFKFISPPPNNPWHFFNPIEWVNYFMDYIVGTSFTTHFFFHVFLANLFIIIAIILHLLLKVQNIKINFPIHLMYIIPILLILGMMIGIENNTGRIISFAAPISILYFLKVIEPIFEKLELGSANGIKNSDETFRS